MEWGNERLMGSGLWWLRKASWKHLDWGKKNKYNYKSALFESEICLAYAFKSAYKRLSSFF